MIVAEGYGQRIGILLLVTSKFYNGIGVNLKKLRGFPHVFRNPLRPIPYLATCLSSPAAREPVSVVISVDLPRKRKVMMEDVNVSNVGERWALC
jgi:hypothetical protein